MLVLALRAFGKVDILVNNAAVVSPLGKVWEVSPRAWQQAININLFGPYLFARTLLPHMLERGSGSIINVSSGAADLALEGASAYTASKAGLERLSQTLAAEVKGTNIVVTVFRPGIVDTAMQAEIRDTPANRFPQVERWHQWHQKGQLSSPSEPALGILWLASNFAHDANGQLFSFNDEQFRERLAVDLQVELS